MSNSMIGLTILTVTVGVGTAIVMSFEYFVQKAMRNPPSRSVKGKAVAGFAACIILIIGIMVYGWQG